MNAAAAKLLQLCLTPCSLIDGSPPGSSTHGIFQARVLEWVAIAFSAMAGPLGTPLGLAQRKRASPRGEAGTSGFLCVSDSDRMKL